MPANVPNLELENELKLMVRSRYGLIMLDSCEEERMLACAGRAAASLSLPLFS
jgi:hypothetical protein